MTQSNEVAYGESSSSPAPVVDDLKVVLHGPGDLAAAVPFLMGYHPTDSVVLLALHGEEGRLGGRVRLALPESPQELDQWPEAARRLAACLVEGSVRRAGRPASVVVFLCRDPRAGECSREVMERLRPLAQELRVAFGALDVPVVEALCVSGGRWWSYCRPGPDEGDGGADVGVPLAKPGASTIAAAAAYAGIPMPATLRELEDRFKPAGPLGAELKAALDRACRQLVPRMLDRADSPSVAEETVALARAALDKFTAAPPIGDPVRSDRRDDGLLDDAEAAEMILGLQDRAARDRVVEWAGPATAAPAIRLWRALARRCAGPYAEHAAALLALTGWVAWCSGDEAEARVALGLALELEPHHSFALLLLHAIGQGLDPDVVRRSVRGGRRRRITEAATVRRGPAGPAGRGPGRRSPGDRRARIRR
jgi:hypothetical protein